MANHGDLSIAAQKITLLSDTQGQQGAQQSHQHQSGLTFGLSSPVVSAAQTAQRMANAAGRTGDARLQDLAATTSALAVSNAADSLNSDSKQAGSAGVSRSLTYGGQSHDSQSESQSSTTVGSTLHAGGNVILSATRPGNESDLTAVGANIRSGGHTCYKPTATSLC